MISSSLDARPIIVAIAGPNGAGKTTFFHAHLETAGLLFLSADVIARELDLDAYDAARLANALRRKLVDQRESFIFETVFSDPVGDKLAFLKQASSAGYTVLLCFIGVSDPDLSEQRVCMRVSQGGHDVPPDKLRSRFPRTLENLRAAIRELPHVIVYDNSHLDRPFEQLAVFANARAVTCRSDLPEWLSL